jgi:hypothetical protein
VTAAVGFVPLEACVVVPARDEQETIAAAAAHPWLRLRALQGRGEGVGVARKLGMDLAAGTLLASGRGHGLIASTDADTVVAPDWLRTQLDLVAAGADAIGGAIDLAGELEDELVRRRRVRAQRRMAAIRARDPEAEHHHFSGASMSLTADAYVTVGGIEPLVALEDEALERRLREVGLAAMGQVDLGERRNRHQTLRELGPMAYSVLVAAERRLGVDVVPGPYVLPTRTGEDVRTVAVDERPPLAAREGSSRAPRAARG